jgi:hypothetical protein
MGQEGAVQVGDFTETSHRSEGYDRLGQLMGHLPEVSAFRRFGALSAEDLLYRQAELVQLETSLRMYQKDDKESDHQDRKRYALNWYKLQRSVSDDAPEGNYGIQWETMLVIREKLKDYCTLIPSFPVCLLLG